MVVKAGHDVVKKNEEETLKGRCDSYVVKTHLHFPTDINLLWDSIRKVVILTEGLCNDNGLTSWRQHRYQLRQIKMLYRKVQKMKDSTSKDPVKKQAKQLAVIAAHDYYIRTVSALLTKAQQTLAQGNSLKV